MRMFSIIVSVLLGVIVIAGSFMGMNDPAAEFDPMMGFGIGIALFAFAGFQWYMRLPQV